jgi:hypothetical protein
VRGIYVNRDRPLRKRKILDAQSGCDGGSLRSDDFLLSVYKGFVFRRARTGYITSGGAISGSLAARNRAGSIELPRYLSDLAPRSSLLDVTLDYGISID